MEVFMGISKGLSCRMDGPEASRIVNEFKEVVPLNLDGVVHQQPGEDATVGGVEAVTCVRTADPPAPGDHLAAVEVASKQLYDEAHWLNAAILSHRLCRFKGLRKPVLILACRGVGGSPAISTFLAPSERGVERSAGGSTPCGPLALRGVSYTTNRKTVCPAHRRVLSSGLSVRPHSVMQKWLFDFDSCVV